MKDLLEEVEAYAEMVDRCIEDALASDRKPSILYESSIHLFKAGGKRVRPFMVLKCCESVGGEVEDAVPLAAAVEVLHTFTLIHDDVMDRSDTRRGVPAVHTVWGIPQAITSGDYLFAKVFQLAVSCRSVSRLGYEKVSKAVKILADATVDISKGQTLDLSFESRLNVSEEEYLEMIRLKTARLFQASAELGVLAGHGSEAEFKALSVYGLKAGLAFQIVDDILGLTGEEEELGKPVGGDLVEGKKTIIVIRGLKTMPARSKSLLTRVLGRRNADRRDIVRAVEALVSHGCVDYARSLALKFRDEALEALNEVKPSEARRSLEELARLFVDRRI